MSARRARPDEPDADPGSAPEEVPDLRPVEGPAADQQLAELAGVIAHPARVRILRLLVRRGRCSFAEIVDELPLAQSTVSQHLRVMKVAGLIRGEDEGKRVSYLPEKRALRRLKALVASL